MRDIRRPKATEPSSSPDHPDQQSQSAGRRGSGYRHGGLYRVEHSPFSASGPCAVSFLMCFACPNAVATDRHLPRIVYLHRALESCGPRSARLVWAADWAVHTARRGLRRRAHDGRGPALAAHEAVELVAVGGAQSTRLTQR